MEDIAYRRINKELERMIAAEFGSWVTDYSCLHSRPNCFALAAIKDKKPIGFISYYAKFFQNRKHAFIDIIQVHEDFRHMHIASAMLKRAEQQAAQDGFQQIYGWSSDDKKAAINMWLQADYTVCPAAMHGESLDKDSMGKPIYGVYAAKLLK